MRALTLLSAGQTVSLLGSSMTGFALVIWAYLSTGEATTRALASLFRFAPTILEVASDVELPVISPGWHRGATTLLHAQ